MNTNDENPNHSGGLNGVTKVKTSIEDRCLKGRSELPTVIQNRMMGSDEDQDCVPLNIASDLLNKARLETRIDLLRQYPYLSLNGVPPSPSTDAPSIDDQFTAASEKASALTTQMIEKGTPIFCVSRESFNDARELAAKHEVAEFMNEHSEKILNGPALLRKADDDFDAVCSRLRMPRRTRTTIRRKKEAAMNIMNS